MMTEREPIVKNQHKTYFKKGDIVLFKGFEKEENQKEMKVLQLVWQTNADGSLKLTNGKKQLEGIVVQWFTEDGHSVEKLVDSRSLYKKEYSGAYFLTEAKKKFYAEGKLDLVEDINKILDKCA